MKNSLLYYLIASSALLVGCEANQSASNTVVARPFGTIFDEQVEVLQKTSLSVIQANKKVTDFSPKESAQEGDQVIQPPGEGLDKKDLLYGFYNSGIVGVPADFDTFFNEVESQNNNTKIASSAGTAPATTVSAFGTFFDSSAGTPADFDNFFSNDSGTPLEFGDFFSSNFNSDFQFDPEKQAKIKTIKENTIATQKNNIVADQIRNKDIDTQLITDLANLEKDIPVKKSELVQMMRGELRHKIRLLDAETALKVAEIKMFSSAKSDNIIARVEDRVLSKTSGVRKELIRKMFISEPENYYQLKEQGKQLDAIYQVDIAKVKLQYQQKIDVVKSDVGSLRVANKKIIDNRYAELEAQRIAEALIIEGETKAKNQEIVDQSYPDFKAKISKYIDAFELKLKLRQREVFVLDRLKEEYISKKSSRISARELENRKYIANINQQIEQEQNTYEDQSRDRLNSARDAKFDSIVKGHKRSINRVESDGAQKIAILEARHAREHEKQKNILQAPYKKKEQILNQKSQQSRSKVLSRFNSENYAIIAKEKKETDVINREINARVKAEIKALLGSFEALKKEEAAIAKKISLEKPKESPGFFESLF